MSNIIELNINSVELFLFCFINNQQLFKNIVDDSDINALQLNNDNILAIDIDSFHLI